MNKFTRLIKTYQADIVLAIAIVLISVISFNLGKISVSERQKPPITITEPVDVKNASLTGDKAGREISSPVVASKNSKGKLYHFSWCPGASKIAEKNKITFTNESAALAAGYTLAGNCQK